MSDFDTDKNAQYAGDKAKNKLDELSGSAQQQFGERCSEKICCPGQ